MDDFDLIIVRRGTRLEGVAISRAESKAVYESKETEIHSQRFSRLEPFADWLGVSDDAGRLVGIRFTTIVQPRIAAALTAENVIADSDDLILLLLQTNHVGTESWPLSTVYSLEAESGDVVLYIPRFFEAGQSLIPAEELAVAWDVKRFSL